MKRISMMLAGAMALCGAAVAVSAGTAGVYTEAQAAQGAAIFAERACVTASRPRDVGSARPEGRSWPLGQGSVAALSDYLARAMPQFAPGTLEPADNVKLVAFLLKTNGHPAGAKPLPEDHAALAAIRLIHTGQCRQIRPIDRCGGAGDMMYMHHQSPPPCACTSCAKATRTLDRLYDARLAPHGLTTTQFALIRNIERAGRSC
jgi:hypothetical protein